MRFLLAPVLTALVLVSVFALPAQARERDPVLFVHGYSGDATNWDALIDDLTRHGWARDELYAISYDYDASNRQTAALIDREVDRILAETEASRVDLVAHSMGSLSSRWYLRFLDGHESVGDWVSLAGPNQGSTVELPCVRTSPSCQEVVVGSDFLAQLNAGDPTPGGARYTTLRSLCDLVVRPSLNVTLNGADNQRVGCVGHTAFLRDAEVAGRVRAALS
ncbi:MULTISPECIES: triacylglycerol lipase [unclassified Nocardiopsis]|uniref:esterase/lipase family protein n=1 Tax=unclassified Nocardiopsis TaxID=2649073 RepID=UPI001357B4B2|nr:MULTISPECIES: triacylglycerol lipase [unclassified Nocardiopsis]